MNKTAAASLGCEDAIYPVPWGHLSAPGFLAMANLFHHVRPGKGEPKWKMSREVVAAYGTSLLPPKAEGSPRCSQFLRLTLVTFLGSRGSSRALTTT